jgi:MFS family permease
MAARSFAPFRHRGFRLRWIGAFVSNVGTWMETVALGYYVADTTGRATWSALLAVGAFGPIAVLGPVGGVAADRFSRRMLMIVTTAVSAVLALVLALGVWQGWAGPGVITVLALGTGCMNALGFPAFQASVPELVPPDEVVAATGLFAVQWNLGRVVGPVFAAVVIAIGGVEWALVANALSFAAVIVAVALVAEHPRERPPRQPVLSAIAEAFRYGAREPGLRSMYAVFLATLVIASPFIAFVPQIATQVLGGDETTTAVLYVVQGVGAVAAGVAMGSVAHRFGLRRTMVGALVLLAPAMVWYGVAPTLPFAAAGLLVVGALYLAAFSAFMAVTQERAPEVLRGRLLSVNNTMLGLVYPLAALVQGALADAIGLRAVTAGAGVALALVLIVGRWLRPGLTHAIDVPVAGTISAVT